MAFLTVYLTKYWTSIDRFSTKLRVKDMSVLEKNILHIRE